jgi:starvation-inducible outer membrane lipoprotein
MPKDKKIAGAVYDMIKGPDATALEILHRRIGSAGRPLARRSFVVVRTWHGNIVLT